MSKKNGETPKPGGGGQKGGKIDIPAKPSPIKGGYPKGFIGKITGR